jgi:hypothetical protein
VTAGRITGRQLWVLVALTLLIGAGAIGVYATMLALGYRP